MSRFKPTETEYTNLPTFKTIETYPNNRRGHALKRYRNGAGACSCDRWDLFGASEPSLIRSHQYHVSNIPG